MSYKYEYCHLSPLGYIRLITTDKALTNIDFIDSGQKSQTLNGYPQIMKSVVSELTLYFMGKLRVFSVNILQEATEFRLKVYDELQRIPYGETLSYKELASKIGNPKAVRAVGGANLHNKIPIIVPCHRVIGADGSLTGYSGGILKKKFLLELERVNC